ncbi:MULTISPECIES: response regulator [unclassified Spirosoma]|mgnify:FL=1|uniref:response regulator n=1 Tax=unclassified Spirosoma TaxID=2621999 RepID=UPI0009655A59|nr:MULTISPECIES: response regulator [unclassified Spirosoma]MBN8823411.1 response regulator [Spirosoma sp.]OJW71971.1 MAG: response regulator [Spirosoma sp. 48-14]
MADVLYIEDDPNDADIFGRLMQKLDRHITYVVLSSGTEAINYLLGKGSYQSFRPQLPKLVLMDLNLDGISGFDIIEQARAIDRTRFLPIVAFSTSDSPRDIRSAYEAGVNAYVVKPGSYPATRTLIDQLCDFWLNKNTRIDFA